MSAIDVRQLGAEEVDEIIFGSGTCNDAAVACKLLTSPLDCILYLEEKGGDTVRIAIDDIPNLILALNKAKELGWDK